MKTSSYILSIALLLLPAAIWAERTHSGFWEQRVAIRSFEYVPKRQDLLYHTGTVLPPHIQEDLILTAADNPVILKGVTVIAPEASLTVEEGVRIFTHEFARIVSHGTIFIRGTADNKVNIDSNQKHSARHSWGGIIFKDGGTGRITHSTIRHGSPAISCLKGSRVTVEHVRLHMGEAGVLAFSDNCNITDSIIHGVRDGIITDNNNFDFNTNRLNGYRNDILHIGKKHKLR